MHRYGRYITQWRFFWLLRFNEKIWSKSEKCISPVSKNQQVFLLKNLFASARSRIFYARSLSAGAPCVNIISVDYWLGSSSVFTMHHKSFVLSWRVNKEIWQYGNDDICQHFCSNSLSLSNRMRSQLTNGVLLNSAMHQLHFWPQQTPWSEMTYRCFSRESTYFCVKRLWPNGMILKLNCGRNALRLILRK